MCLSEKKINAAKSRPAAFTFIEVITAITILAAIVGTVFVVVDRCVSTTIDIEAKTQAFEIARENMETLLASDSVKETTEFGSLELNPDIEWTTVVEPFYEPVTNRMWIRAVCSASYSDSTGERQTVELTHWLTDVTKTQLQQIIDQQQRESEYLDALEEMGLEESDQTPDSDETKEPTDETKPADIGESGPGLDENILNFLRSIGWSEEQIQKFLK